jgi:hypothetical protein
MTTTAKQVARFRPSTYRSIHLYSDGTIRSPWGSGHVRGATAHVDESGNRKLFRDFRTAILTIEGPEVVIVRTLNVKHDQRVALRARKFAAEVNRLSRQLESGNGN